MSEEINLIKKYFDYNPDSGFIKWKKSPNRKIKAGQIAGAKHKKKHTTYIIIRLNGKNYSAHRLAWLLYYGEWPKKIIDHIDHNGLNNKIENLRDVSYRENSENRKHNNKYIGVIWHKKANKWVAVTSVENSGKLKHLGCFKTHYAACYARHAYEQR